MKFLKILKTILSEIFNNPESNVNNHIDEYYCIYYGIKK